MADRSLDTGEFDEYGRWKKYSGAQSLRSGPSPWPLLVVALLIAVVMLLRGGSDSVPRDDHGGAFVLTNVP
jgi:hypothetical protein